MSGGGAKLLGRWGEAAVAEDLRRRGFRVVSSGYHCRFGEIDLIAEDGTYLVFVEVKLRRNAAFGPACAAVDARKQAKLRITAEDYLARHPTALQPRFDVAEVYAPQGTDTKRPDIRYIENAF
mgnify:CR=1 FL=1